MDTSDNPPVAMQCMMCHCWVHTIVCRGGAIWCLACDHKKLMREVLDDLRVRGVQRVALTVYSDNIPAVKLYTGLGFREPNGQITSRYTRRMTLDLVA